MLSITSYNVLGFLNPMHYVKMKRLSDKKFELLPVTPVFMHRKNTAEKPGYYSDIIMHTDVELENINPVCRCLSKLFFLIIEKP